MRTVRASEIGTYLYCKRAWWYQRQGIPSANQADLAAGERLHEQHGRAVFLAGCLRTIAWVVLLAGLGLAAAALAQQIF